MDSFPVAFLNFATPEEDRMSAEHAEKIETQIRVNTALCGAVVT